MVFLSRKTRQKFYPSIRYSCFKRTLLWQAPGQKKQNMEEKYGTEKLTSWDLDFEPGLLEGENLKVVYERAVPYFKKEVLPAIKKGKNVIVCAHHSSLRALVKYIEDISDKNIKNVRFSTGDIVRYNFSEGRLVKENAEIALKQK